ncbi:ubiquitin-like protein Pup [Rothia sp. P7181]|uniref:ubiquitin-like protein Pup n=1 Tax=unclassified Rothia (in: high G+C Gram-positive bacteria) TaxID=2689056 RepID=UPI003AC25287
MERQRIQAQQQQNLVEETPINIASQSAAINQDLIVETDDLLAEIDGLLEENAEDFVKGFVQKGGE